MEVTQFTYFQQVAGLDCKPMMSEITYGVERLAMTLQEKESVYDLIWSHNEKNKSQLTYGDIFHQNEVEHSYFNYEYSNVDLLVKLFLNYESEALKLLEHDLPIPAYDLTLKAAHIFNLLDARGTISVTERASYIGKIRNISKNVGIHYLKSREKLGFPLVVS